MSKLQNDFTTRQQSRKLLALGMPRLSANFYYDDENEVQIIRDPEFELQSKGYFPCWSVGRLIEIMKICNHPDDVDEVFCELAYSKKNIVELIVSLMEENKAITDFSKLEE
jgi:hypothetical protein